MNINGRFFAILIVLFLLTTGNLSGLCADAVQSEGVNNSNCELPVLNMYTWVEYIDPAILSDFEKEFHVKVHVDFYDDEEVMFSSVQSQPERYDVIFPSDSLTDVMIKSSLLSKLEIHCIPNVRNLREKFRVITSRKWKGYSIPLDWGVTGIAYNTKYVKEAVDSWCIFWEKRYAGKMALLNNSYDVMTIGQKRLAESLNPINPEVIERAFRLLKESKPLLQEEGFLSYTKIMERMKNETLWIAQCYNGDAALIKEENPAVKFIIPKEGSGLWMDNIAIPAGAKNKRLAEKFINFMLRPEISAGHTNFCYYANCNKKAGVFVNKEVLNNKDIHINKRELERLELYEILSPNVQNKFNECWAELVAH